MRRAMDQGGDPTLARMPALRAASKEIAVRMEVRTVRRLALLLAGGALWIVFSAAPAFADGGPHRLTLNNGTSGLSGDCAACHRAHTAQAADLLKEEVPGLCLACHDGTGATADVVDGYQFVPDGSGNPTGSILGALRGGGFSYALIGDPARLSYASRGSIILTYGAAPGSGNVTLHWDAFGTFGGGDLTFAANSCPTSGTLNGFFGTSTTYTGSGTPVAYTSGTTTSLMTCSASLPSSSTGLYTISFSPKNEFALVPSIPLPSVTANASGTTATMSSTIQATVGATSHVGVLAEGAAVTSTHLGAGTVWGNGPQGQSNVGATGVTLSCTNCHNPHGNGQYRILDTIPGEDWANDNGTNNTGIADWTASTNDVEVVDGPTLTGSEVHNYTVKPGYLASDVTGAYTLGDYFRYKFDPTGTSNFTNFYLIQDPMNTGWNGTSPTNALAVGTASTTLTSALTATGTTAVVASLTGMPTAGDPALPQPVFIIKIGNELMTASLKVSSGAYVANSLTIARGYNGTTGAAHAISDAVDVQSSDPTVDPDNAQLYNNLGRMTAFCIQCHTRYNGWSQNGTSSLVAQTPTDDIFMFKHGTTRLGCEQCHVNHGTNVLMTAQFSSAYKYADGTPEDSALLKVDNRGTCNLCHDPTHTVKPGTTVGTVPIAITPGP
jgi:predicted CXXCH cytochrome family protein